MALIPIAGPWITQKEIDYVAEAARTAWYADANTYQRRFEQAFAETLGVTCAVALPSCTAGLHLALLALGIGPGDEVIVPDITWIATSAPIDYVGATPVFADVDGKTWCLSLPSVEACITPKTRAIIAVDLYGNLPDMDGLRELADLHSIPIVEDAAEAIGSRYRGRHAGSFGDIGVFSFHGTKTLTTGEGGMLVTSREDLLQPIRALQDHGRHSGEKMFWPLEIGYKYKMSALQAALGLAQLERLDELVTRKREIFSWYRQELEGMDGLQLNDPTDDVCSSYWMVTLVLDGRRYPEKECLMARLKARGIDSRPFFYPLSQLPMYASTPEGRCAAIRNRTAYALSPYGIHLPSSFSLTREQVEFVCGEFRKVVAEKE